MTVRFQAGAVALAFVIFASAVAAQTPPPPPAAGPAPSKDLFDAIHVVVGPSSRALDPVALVPSRCEKGSAACGEIDKVLDRDLTLSGYFKVLDRASFLGDLAAENLDATKWDDWFNVGAKYVIKATAGAAPEGVALEFRLLDVTAKKAIPVKGQSARVASTGVRRATHQFVNGVIEAVTGKPGIFGSEIVMSQKAGPWVRNVISMEMDGSGRQTLVTNGSSNMFPRWGPGGSVLFTSFLPGFPSLYVGGRRVTSDTREYRGADFSPDGRVIAASVDMGGQSDLVLVDPKTGAITKTLTETEWDEVSPSWSPDGRQVAFVSNRTGNPQVYLVGAGGGEPRRLTMAGSYNTSPRFGPNGLVVFAGMDGYTSDIFTVDLQGNVSRLTQDQGSNKDPTWSPDGRYVAFLSNRAGGWKVWIMTDDGRYQFPITESAGGYATPDWGR
jgi:TolB protein